MRKKGEGVLWALCGHVNDAYPSCSMTWFLASVGYQAFNIPFRRILRSDEVVDGLFRFFSDERGCWCLLVSDGVCSVVSYNAGGVYS